MKNVWTTKKDQDTIVYPDTILQNNKKNIIKNKNN